MSWSTGTFPAGLPDEALRWAERMGFAAGEVSPRHAPAVNERFERGLEWRNPTRVRLASLHAWTRVEDLEAACATLPAPPGVERSSLEGRLYFYGMEYFAGQFARLLRKRGQTPFSGKGFLFGGGLRYEKGV